MSKPIQIAVVGHTNVGKTSLLRTLTRKVNFGKVDEQPGTTRHPESVDFRIDGVSVIRYWDTPGMEDSASLHHFLQEFWRTDDSAAEWIRAFLKGPEASKSFEQEAKVLRKMIDVDAAIYVIDCRADTLPKYKYEIQILSACAKPILPILNFVRHADSQEAKWQELLKINHLHVMVRFDAVAPFVGSERKLYDYLSLVLEDHHEQFKLVTEDIERQASERQVASCRLLADLMVSVASMRRGIDKADIADDQKKAAFELTFKRELVALVRTCIVDLLEVHAFRKEDAEVAIPSWESGRWESDVLNPDVLLNDGKRIGTGALVGGAVGLAVDLLLAGMSLGAASAIGATIGGVLGEGLGQVPHKVINLVRGKKDLTLGDEALIDLIHNMVRLIKALEIRGHASMDKVDTSSSLTPGGIGRVREVAQALKTARSDANWERRIGSARPNNKKREKLVGLVEKQLLGILRL